MNEKELDRILEAMRQEEPHPGELAAAQERVWHTLNANTLCLQFREQFPAYRNGSLTEAKQMLLDDHLARCADCRRALAREDGRRDVIEMPVKTNAGRRRSWKPWLAGAAIAAIALLAGRQTLDRMFAPSGPRAGVRAINGTLHGLTGIELKPGSPVSDQEAVRTGAGSRATLQLADGSLVEMNERTELHLTAAWSGQTIHLERGDIIVQAAKQRRGELRVVTRDSEAAVKGTIFTVSTGTAGSLVGVVEGSVAVTQPGAAQLLKPGEKAATNAALSKITVKQAVAWSTDAEKHFALLSELAAIEAMVTPAAVRTQGRLLAALPPDITVYGAMPNLGPALNQVISLIEQRSGESAILKEWWSSTNAAETKQLIERVRAVSPLLGDELIFVLSGKIPVVLAEIKAGQEAALQQQIAPMAAARNGLAYRFVNQLLVVTDTPEHLGQVLGGLGQGASTPFVKEVASRYSRGVSWILGVDMGVLHSRSNDKEAAMLMGATDVRYLFLEQRTVDGIEENEATLTFAGPRTGVASWLAGPAASGSAEYASPDALAVISAATRTPEQVFHELLGLLSRFDAKTVDRLRAMESETGVNVSAELAASLGTDFTISVETPTLPVPGWIAAIEVYRPEAVDAALERLVESYNRRVPASEDNRKLVATQESVDGRVWKSIGLGMPGFGFTWTYDRGYLVAGADRGVVSRAISTRASGLTLIRSDAFRSRLPGLTGLHPSAFAWFHLEEAAKAAGEFAKNPALKAYQGLRAPSLIAINGETERIRAASRTRITSLVLDALMTKGPGRGTMNP